MPTGCRDKCSYICKNTRMTEKKYFKTKSKTVPFKNTAKTR